MARGVRGRAETAEIYQHLAEGDPNLRSDLAEALVMHARLEMIVKPEEALRPAQRAIELLQQMDSTNPAVRVPLAAALTVLSLTLRPVRKSDRGGKTCHLAVALLRQLGSDNPAFGPDLANALTAQGIGLCQAGHVLFHS